jgi:hypothetical protein
MSMSQAQVLLRAANKVSLQSSPLQEPHLHRCGSHPISDRATRADPSNLWRAVRLAGEMKGCTPSTMHTTSAQGVREQHAQRVLPQAFLGTQ